MEKYNNNNVFFCVKIMNKSAWQTNNLALLTIDFTCETNSSSYGDLNNWSDETKSQSTRNIDRTTKSQKNINRSDI